MTRVSIYVKNKQYKPSNYYRMVQYVDYFNSAKVKVRSLIPNILYVSSIKYRDHFIYRKLLVLLTILISGLRLLFFLTYDTFFVPQFVVIQKSLSSKVPLPYFLYLLLKHLLKHSFFIWDFDDNIVYDKEITQQEFDLYCNYSQTIIIPNPFLKTLLPKDCFNKILLLPTTDCNYYLKNTQQLHDINTVRKQSFKKQINLIWVGTSANLIHLERILPILEETAKDVFLLHHKKLMLTIVCDKTLSFETHFLTMKHVVWSRTQAFDEQTQSHIGLMPLIDNEYTRGKAGFKLVQYLASGLPIIASNVGYNKNYFSNEVGFLVDDSLHLEEWKQAILALIQSETLWESYSFQSYDFFLKHFNPVDNIKTLKNLLDA